MDCCTEWLLLVSYELGWFYNVCKKLTFQVLHAPGLFGLVHWLQNCFSFHSRRFPFHLRTLGSWLLVLHCNNGGYCSKIWCPDRILVNHGIFQDGISYSDFARFLEDVWNPHLLNKILENEIFMMRTRYVFFCHISDELSVIFKMVATCCCCRPATGTSHWIQKS